MGIRTTTARLYFLLPYPSHIGTLDGIAPRRRVCHIAPILIPLYKDSWHGGMLTPQW